MNSCAADRTRTFAAVALAIAFAPLFAQDEPRLHVTFGDRGSRLLVPAIEWLCGSALPARTEWPRDLDPNEPFAIVLSTRGLEVMPTRVALPPGVVAAGSCSIGDAAPMVFSCTTDGSEDWYVPRDFVVPGEWRTLLTTLHADALDEPRSLDAAVVIGHVAGAFVDGDPRGELSRLGGSACGVVAWTAWATPSHLRVRGKSDGGLVLPAALLLLASSADAVKANGLALRAFAARDGDRAEAARQFVRTPDERSLAALRALLLADDTVALAAIDTLVRLRRADELPAIVAAARPEAPWAQLAAADALRELWMDASPTVRNKTRRAIESSASITVRSIDLDRLPTRTASTPRDEAPPPADEERVRALVVLALFGIGLWGLLARERRRLAVAPIAE